LTVNLGAVRGAVDDGDRASDRARLVGIWNHPRADRGGGPMSWRLRWRIYEYVRNSLWIIPGLLLIIAIWLGIFLPDVDEGTKTTIGLSFGSGAAESILGAIAGGMITFTGFVFSVLLLAVQFGSSQFSPRMLRRFLRDPVTKVALGVFIATFTYALMVLRTVGVANRPNFVPDNSISVALLWLLISMLMFLSLPRRSPRESTTPRPRSKPSTRSSTCFDCSHDGDGLPANVATSCPDATGHTSPG
jgi:hypothetical protein